MDIYSIWPSIAIVAVCLLLTWPKQLWRFLDDPLTNKSQRYMAVDGLRGFLALAVVLHHCVIGYGFQQTGEWKLPPSSYYSVLGQAGVSVFFMITAFLFWGRLLDEGKRIDWFAIYCGRFFRIVPLYWVVITLMLVVVAIKTGFRVAVPPADLLSQIFQWLLPALAKGRPIVNGYVHTNTITAGVTWTLYYEWMFYFSLPLLAIAAAKRSLVAFLPVVIWTAYVLPELFTDFGGFKGERYFLAMFAAGILSASAIRRFPELVGDGALKSTAALALLVYTLLNRSAAYEWVSIALLGAFFILVSSGASLFGLLTSRSAVRLGAISYGVYLLQGLVIATFLSQRFFGDFSRVEPANFWLITLAVVVALVCIAAASYHLIERPCIRFGKRVAKGRVRIGGGANAISP